MRVQGFVASYQERALNAVVEVGDAGTAAELRKIAAQPAASKTLRDRITEAVGKLANR